MWSIYTVESDSAVNKDEPLKLTTRWMNLDNVMLKPVRKSHILCDRIDMKCPEQASSESQKADRWLPGAEGRGQWGATIRCLRASCGQMNMYWNTIDVVVRQHAECPKRPWMVQFTVVHFMLREFTSVKREKKMNHSDLLIFTVSSKYLQGTQPLSLRQPRWELTLRARCCYNCLDKSSGRGQRSPIEYRSC